MSKYPIKAPETAWKYAAFAIVAGCMKRISSVNPGVWEDLIVNPNSSGLGLMLHKPGSEIINFANRYYPELTYNNGLVQIEFFLRSATWKYETPDTWSSFKAFTTGCTNSLLNETQHFLYQIGYSETRADAQTAANDFISTINDIYTDYQDRDPKLYLRSKWKYGNYQITNDDIANNINILYAYSKGYVYKNLAWLYFKLYGWR